MTGFLIGVGAGPPRAGNSSFGSTGLTDDPKDGLATVLVPKEGLAEEKVGLSVELKVDLSVEPKVGLVEEEEEEEEVKALKSRVV